MGQAALKLEEYERVNVSALSLRYDLDRATVKKRLAAAGIEPIETKAKETIYELNQRVDSVLNPINDPMAEVKLRAARADAEFREAKVQQIRRDLVPMAEAQELTQRIFASLHREIVIQQPKRLASRLARVKTPSEAAKLMKTDSDAVFRKLREEPDSFLT